MVQALSSLKPESVILRALSNTKAQVDARAQIAAQCALPLTPLISPRESLGAGQRTVTPLPSSDTSSRASTADAGRTSETGQMERLPTITSQLADTAARRVLQTGYNYPVTSNYVLTHTGVPRAVVTFDCLLPSDNLQKEIFAIHGALSGVVGVARSAGGVFDARNARLIGDAQGVRYAAMEFVKGGFEVLSGLATILLSSKEIALAYHTVHETLEAAKHALEFIVLAVSLPLAMVDAVIAGVKLRNVQGFLHRLMQAESVDQKMVFLVSQTTPSPDEREKAYAMAKAQLEASAGVPTVSDEEKALLEGASDQEFLSRPEVSEELRPYLESELVKLHLAKGAALSRLLSQPTVNAIKQCALMESWGAQTAQLIVNSAMDELRTKRITQKIAITSAALIIPAALLISVIPGPNALIIVGLSVMLTAQIGTMTSEVRTIYEGLSNNPQLRKLDKYIIALSVVATAITVVLSLTVFSLNPLVLGMVLGAAGLMLAISVGTRIYARRAAEARKNVDDAYTRAQHADEQAPVAEELVLDTGMISEGAEEEARAAVSNELEALITESDGNTWLERDIKRMWNELP